MSQRGFFLQCFRLISQFWELSQIHDSLIKWSEIVKQKAEDPKIYLGAFSKSITLLPFFVSDINLHTRDVHLQRFALPLVSHAKTNKVAFCSMELIWCGVHSIFVKKGVTCTSRQKVSFRLFFHQSFFYPTGNPTKRMRRPVK